MTKPGGDKSVYKKGISWLALDLDRNAKKDIREVRYSEKKIGSMNYKS